MDKKTKPRRNSEKRREKSRDAARQRRNQETHIFMELADTLPLAKGKTRQLDKASIMRLTLCLMKQHDIRQRVKDTWQAPSEVKSVCILRNNGNNKHQFDHRRSITNGNLGDKPVVTPTTPPTSDQMSIKDDHCPPSNECHSTDADTTSLDETFVAQLYAKALDGFVIILSRDGEVVDVSEHVGKYLGIQQIDLLGQNIYEYIHPCDHEQLRTELGPSKADRTAGVNTWPSPRQVFSMRVKSTLTTKGRNINLKSASYKVIKFSGQLLCPSADVHPFPSASTSSSAAPSPSTECLSGSSLSPFDMRLAKQVTVVTDGDNDGDDEDEGHDDVVVIGKKGFRSAASKSDVFAGGGGVDDDGGGGQKKKKNKNKYKKKDGRDDDGDGDDGDGDDEEDSLPFHRHYLSSKPLPRSSSSSHYHKQQQQSTPSSSSLTTTTSVTAKEEEGGEGGEEDKENGRCKWEGESVGGSDEGSQHLSYLLQLPLLSRHPSYKNNSNSNPQTDGSADDMDEGFHRFKQEEGEANGDDTGDAERGHEEEDSKYNINNCKLSSPDGSPADRRRQHSGGSSTEQSSGETTGRVRMSTAYFVAFGEPIPHPANIEVPLGSQTFLSQHSMDMRFTIWDEKIKELVGYTSEDIIGHSIYEYYHGLDAEMVGQAFKELITKGQITTGQYRFLAKQGGHVWLITQATVIYDNRSQKPLYVVCVHCVLSEIENQHEILSIVQQPISSSSQSQTDVSIKDSKSHDNKNKNIKLLSSSSSSSASASSRPVSGECSRSYALLVARKIAASRNESHHMLKSKKEVAAESDGGGGGSTSHRRGDNNSNDGCRTRNEDGDKPSLSPYSLPLSPSAGNVSKSMPSSSATANSLSSSSHLLVLSRLGSMMNQREEWSKMCNGDVTKRGFGSVEDEMQQQPRGQERMRKIKRRAINNEAERVINNMKNDYGSETSLVKEEDDEVVVVGGCKDSGGGGGSSGRDEHDGEEREDSKGMKWKKKRQKADDAALMKDGVVVNALNVGLRDWPADKFVEALEREAKMHFEKAVKSDKKKDNSLIDWKNTKKGYNGEARTDESVLADGFDGCVGDYSKRKNTRVSRVSRYGGKMSVEDIDSAGGEYCEDEDEEMEERGRRKKACNKADSFDSILEVSEYEVETDGEEDERIDGRVKDGWNMKNNKYNVGSVEMKEDVMDNGFDIGIRDVSDVGNEEMNVDSVVIVNGKYDDDDVESDMMVELTTSRQRKAKKMKNDLSNDPMMIAKKKKKMTKSNEFVNQNQPLTSPMKDLKIESDESEVFGPNSIGYSLTPTDFTVVPSALIEDDSDDDDVTVVGTSTENPRCPTLLPRSVASDEGSDNNREVNSVGTYQQELNHFHDRYGTGHSPGLLLNTERIFTPRTKDMDEDHSTNPSNISPNNSTAMLTPFVIENNNRNSSGVTGSNSSGRNGSTNMLIDDFVAPTTMLFDAQDDCGGTSTAGCINALDDLTFRAPSAGDVCIDLSVPPNFESLFKVPSIDVDDSYNINTVGMSEICDNKPQCVAVPDLSSQLQDFNVEEAEYDIMQTTLTSNNESMMLSPDIGDMMYSKNMLSSRNKSETGLDKGLLRRSPFNESPSLRPVPTKTIMVNRSPNPESNIELNTLAPNKGPMMTQIQQPMTPTHNRNPKGNLQVGEGLKRTIAQNMGSPPIQQLMMTDQPGTITSNVSCNTNLPDVEDILMRTCALNNECSPSLIQQPTLTERLRATISSAANPNSKLQAEKMLKCVLALNRSPMTSLSDSMVMRAQIQQPMMSPNLSQNSNQALLHSKELSVQPDPGGKIRGPTPGKVRRLEPLLMSEEVQHQEGDGGVSPQQGFGWRTAQTRRLIHEYGSANNKDSVLRNLLVSGEDRNNGYFVNNQHVGMPYLMPQTLTDPPTKMDSSFLDRVTNKNSVSTAVAGDPTSTQCNLSTVANSNHHEDNNSSSSSLSPTISSSSVKRGSNQKQQDWVWWWALNTTVTSPTVSCPSSIITSTSSSTSSKDNVMVSSSADAARSNVISPTPPPPPPSYLMTLGSSSYDKRALFGEDLVGSGSLDQTTLNGPSRLKGPRGSFLCNSTLSQSSDDIQALFREGIAQPPEEDIVKKNVSCDDISKVSKGTTTTTAATSTSSNSSSSSSSSSTVPTTRRLSSSLLHDDIQALFGVDLDMDELRDATQSNPITRGTNSVEGSANQTGNALSNLLPNGKSSRSSYNMQTMFGVDLVPAGQLNMASPAECAVISTKTTTTATNNGIRTPNTQSSAVIRNSSNNINMKYGVKMPNTQSSARPQGLAMGLTTAPKWLPRLTQTDCEVNAPIWSGERLLNGTELLKALDVENIF